MKTEKFEGQIESAYGKTIEPALKYSGEFGRFENIDELRSRNEFPKDSEIVDMVNARRKANARQKAMTAALDAAGYEKPTLENDVQLQLRTVYKALVANGKSEQEARDIASRTLGVAWE